ncbi:MAG: DUF262 domain-containing protein [Bacteroidetes bacterium SB0662_bin_6]|nr:DUF262 domain-containing protein [Bacteroidetes bacterium SB0668_bin_1]MYE03720.1 DUF262 domain-containing protein [Bacteroidetes bacterium SB0662_bin_6]
MDTSILTPKGLFGKDIRYTVPDFQRRYVWTQEDQWEPLWEDTRNTAEDYLEKLGESNDKEKEIPAEQKTARHFLGAVVVQQVNTATKDIERREVIDGQQRLTTLQLLLDAIQYVCENHDVRGVATRLSKLVTNDQDLVKDDDEIFKLWPTTSDREAFRRTMHNGLATDGHENSRIVQAHEYFQLQAKEWIGSNPESIQGRAEALETAVTKMLQMVVIDLGSQDDPHIIFETLNARGTPLLESDLIKNYVTSKAGQTVQDDIWGDLDDDWWRKELRQGRLIRPRIDALLDYWLEMDTKDDVTAGRVFNVFKKVADSRQIADIMSAVKADLSNYRRYEEGPRKPIEEVFHYRASVMQMGAFTPALLTILSRPDKARFGALQALESFLVRRMVCRNTTKDYNRLSLDLVRALLDKCGPESADKAVVGFLRDQEADSRRWPTDEDLENSLCTLPLYRLLTRGRLRLVLEGIEQKYRENHFAEETDVPKYLTIEHVLPQSWETHWPLPNGVDELEAKQKRNSLIDTIGNLTLISGRLNSSAKNAPWERKRETLEKHSVFFLNRVLLAESKDTTWDEQFIEARSKKMAEMVAEVWPGPDSSAWNRDS